MKISIEAERCQGHGRCYELAPDLVTDDDRGRGSVVTTDVPADAEGDARAAASACPEHAVLLGE